MSQELLTRTPAAQFDGSGNLVEVDPDPYVVYEELTRRGLTDGLPVIPPTPARVQAMLAAAGRDPQEVIGLMPPSEAPATVEQIAANAVMAGCAPSYFPVVLSLVDACLDPVFNLRQAIATTYTSWPMYLISGPIAQEIGLTASWGFLGTGFRANVTIGRALTLCFMTIGGCFPGISEKKPVGSVLRLGLCITEYEELSPWEPLRVELGYSVGDDVAVAIELNDPRQIHIWGTGQHGSAVGWLSVVARGMAASALTGSAAPDLGNDGNVHLLTVPPFIAKKLADDGWTKNDVKRYLYENARIPREEFVRWRFHDSIPPDTVQTELTLRYGGAPRWVKAQMLEPSHSILQTQVPIVRDPDDLFIIVGGSESKYCQPVYFTGHDHGHEAIIRKIERKR